MPSINKLYFIPFSAAENTQSLSAVRKLIADKFVYTADDDLMTCCAILNNSTPIIGDTAEVYLKTADLVTTVASATKVSTIETNRIFFSVDISDLAAGSYTLQAFISESGSPGVSSGGALLSFNFTKTSTTDVVTFPPLGLQIYPQDQDYISDVIYPMHAAIPVPKGTIDYAEISGLGLYENGVQIAAQIEIVDNWEGVPTDVDQPYRPRWIHVWFNAVWVTGAPKTYLLKKSAGTPPASGMTVTATDEFTFACTVDLATSTYSMATNYYLPVGRNDSIRFPTVTSNVWTASTSGHNCKTGTPIIFSSYGSVGNMVKGQIYYLRSLTPRTFTLHATYVDAINNTNIFNTGAVASVFPSLQPIKPVPIKVTYGTSTALIPDSYPQIDPTKVYWANFIPAVSGAASFTVHETYDDALNQKNKITFLSSTAGHSWTLMCARTFLATGGSSWNSVRGHNDVVNHNLTTGMKVRGYAYYSVTGAIDETKIYYVRSVTSSNFTLHPTLADALANTAPVTVSSSLNPHYFMVVSTITVDNGHIKAIFSRPFDGFHELYYDTSGTGTYTTPYVTSAGIGWNAGLYMKDGRERDWNAFADPFGYVDVEYQNAAQPTQNCNVVIRAEGNIQTMYQHMSPLIHYSMRLSIPAKMPMVKCHLATTILENTSKAIRSLVFNLPIQNAYLLSGGIDESTVSENTRTITGVSTPNINLNSAHGWSSGQAVTFFTTGTLPSPLVQGTTYYVVNPASDTIQVALTSGGSAITLTTSGSGTRKVYVDSPAYFYQKKHDSVAGTGAISASGAKCDGWFSASGLSNDYRTTLLLKNTWQKFPKEIALYRNNVGLHIWPYHGTRNFTTDEDSSAREVYKYNCFHQHLCLDTNVPNDYYQVWADQTDTTEELRPEWAMGANAQGVSMSNDFAFIFSDSDSAFDAANWALLYQLDPIALCDDDWNADSKAFLTLAEKGSDFGTQETAIEEAIIGWTNPEKVEDYGQFNYGDYHGNYIISQDRANLGECWQNMRHYFTSQVWSLILRGSSNLMDIARRATDHYASVDMTRFDGNFGYFGGDLSRSNLAASLISGPEHKGHYIGNFWKGGPIHWANNDYGADDSIPLRGIHGSIPDPVGLLRGWLIDGNRWAKAGFEQWLYAIRVHENPPVSISTPSKETIGTLVNALWAREYTHDPILAPQIDACKTALSVTSSTKIASFAVGNNVTITSHGYQTGQRIRFTTTGSLPSAYPDFVVGKTYYVCVHDASTITIHPTLQNAYDYLYNVTSTAITFSNTGTGSHSAITGNIGTIDDPTWHPLWLNWYYELTSDPNYTQWILDNAIPSGYGISALAYSLTSDPIYLTRHFTELLEAPNLLHEEDGNKWDKFGVGPGEEKHFWHAFPYFKKQLQNANITSLASPSITLQPSATEGDDIYIISADPTGNYDTATNMSLGDIFFVIDINARILIRFKLDLPAGATITSATLTLTNMGGGVGISNDTINIYRLLRPWTETGVTWNNYNDTSSWTTAGGNGVGTDYTTTGSVSVVLANSDANLVANVAALAQDAIDNRGGLLSLLMIGPESQGTSKHANYASSNHATAAWHPKLALTWTTAVDTGNYPIALGTPGNIATASNTILVNNLTNDWDMAIDVADVTGSESMDVVISTISGTILNTNYTFPTSTSFTFDRNGTLVHRQQVNLSGASAGSVQSVTVRTNSPEIYQGIGPHPEALLMTDFTEATAPVYRAKSFKGYFVPKIEGANIDLTFTTTGDGGFTRLLIKDDNDDVISNTSLMFGRDPETIVIQPNGSGLNNDTYIRQDTTGTNYGSATFISVGHSTEEGGKTVQHFDVRSILKFDLTSAIDYYISSATLTLTRVSYSGNQTLNLYRCGQANWTELGATWNTYNGSNNWSAGDPTTPSTSVLYAGESTIEFDITELVKDAIENRSGILNCVLDGSTDSSYVIANFASFENATSASRPKITINTSTALTITINDANETNPTPWYVEATSNRNAYVDVKVEGPGDATPILFGADRDATYNLKYWAIGTPVAEFTANNMSGEAPFEVEFTDLSTNTPNTWLWNFGDGNTSTEKNPVHIYTTSGTYNVSLTASSPAGSDVETKNSYVVVTDILDDAPLWGLNYDPMGELMNRGEGNRSTATIGLPGVLARNPMLVKAPDGSVVFLCHSASGFTNNGHGLTFAIRAKRSTDNGLTWSAPIDVYNYSTFSPNTSWFQLSGAVIDEIGVGGDPAIIVFGTKGDTTNQHHQNYTFRSEDNGVTWSAADEITSQITNPLATTRNVAGVSTGANTVTTSISHGYATGQAIVFDTSGTLPAPLVAGRTYFARVSTSVVFFVHLTYDDAQAATNTIDLTDTGTGAHTVSTMWAWNIPTGVGIQLSDNSSNPGRLIMPCNHRTLGFNPNDTNYGPLIAHVISSDDGGVTWSVLGQLATLHTEDATIIETTTPDKLYMSIASPLQTYRAYSTSVNGGAIWTGALADSDLLQLAVQGQLVRLNDTTIMLATTRDVASVTHKGISLYVSSDDGTNWTFAKTLFYRYAENCGVLPLNDNHILLAFENSQSTLSNATPASNFLNDAYQSISLVKLNKVWLDDTAIPEVSEWFFNEESSGVRINPYSPAIIDYGGRSNNKGVTYSVTNTALYTSDGVDLTDANNDAIILSAGLGDIFTNNDFTIEVEATIGVGENGFLISEIVATGITLEVLAGVLKATLKDGTFTTTTTGVTAVNDGVKRCYAVVRDKSGTNRLYIYIDGVLESGHVADVCGVVTHNTAIYLGQDHLFNNQLDATFHSCRITNQAVAGVDLKVAPRTKITPHTYRNYTPPTPPAFVPTDLTDLETWLFASVDEGESGFADSQWSLSYTLPYYSGAKISSYRDKSANKYFFNVLETGWIEYVTDTTIGPHYRPYFEGTTPSNANLTLKRDAASVYNFVPGGTFAIGMAVKINSMVGGGNQILLDTQDASSANAGFHVYIDSNRKPGINVGGGAGAFNYVFTSATAMTVGDWYFLLYVGRGVGAGIDLYIGHYTNGAYNPLVPTIPALTKITSTNMTSPALTTNANPLTLGAKASDGTSPSDVYLKNVVILSEASQFATGDTINQDQLCAFNLYA